MQIKINIGDMVHIPTLNKSGYIANKIGRLYLVTLLDGSRLFKANEIILINTNL